VNFDVIAHTAFYRITPEMRARSIGGCRKLLARRLPCLTAS